MTEVKITEILWVNNKYKVVVGDDQEFFLSSSDYYRLALYEKESISIEELLKIKDNEIFEELNSIALRSVVRRRYTKKELEDKLLRVNDDEDIVQKVVCKMEELGYIDDFEYAKRYLRDRMRNKPLAESLIKRVLVLKGISQEFVEQSISEVGYVDEIILDVVRKKFGNFDSEDEKRRKKVINFLKYRGYSYLEAINILSKLTS